MFETYRLLGREREVELVREAARVQRTAHTPRRSSKKIVYSIGAVVALSITSALVLVASAHGSDSSYRRSGTTPAWARPLSGVRPYVVEHNYGTSRGLTCDLHIFTTNRAALDGNGRLRPGDVTATVCIVRRVGH